MRNYSKLYLLLFAATLVFICYTYYEGVWDRLPYGIHEWAQGDRLALAINYYDNGMHFSLPSTYSQYSVNGITGVEFPIQSYLAACLGFVFGRSNISTCFRLLDTVITCIGLLALYLTMFRATKDFILSLVAPVFIFCSPVFIAYTCNYLPDTASVSVCFVSFYFLFDYLQAEKKRSLVVGIALLGLATLIKTSTGVYLIGATAFGLLDHIKNRKAYTAKNRVWFAGTVFVAYAAVIGWYLYTQYLNTKYNSILFLSKPAPFDGMKAFDDYINQEFKNLWIKEYMVFPQYVVLAVLLIAILPFMHKEPSLRRYLRMFLLFLAGSLCMFFLIGNQLLVHDYYIIAIFFPMLAFGIMCAILYLRTLVAAGDGRKIMNTALLTCMITTFFFADYQTYRRLRTDYKPFSDWSRIYWMENGSQLLKELHIAADEKITVLNEYAPNLALCYFDRKGWVLFPEFWNNDAVQIKKFMQERQSSVVVFDAKLLNAKLSSDSTFFKDFTVLHSDTAAVLKLKQ
ncbi:ArnT family glycosyltransferase [Chitinophagaceae bacterium MMS25-I14]